MSEELSDEHHNIIYIYIYHYVSWAGKAETVSLTWLFKKRLSGFRPPTMFVIRISLQSSGGRTWRKSQAAPGSQSQSSQKYPATLGWRSQVLPIVRQDDVDSPSLFPCHKDTNPPRGNPPRVAFKCRLKWRKRLKIASSTAGLMESRNVRGLVNGSWID